MFRVTERRLHILTGAITMTLLSALTVFGVKVANGSLDDVYHLEATFSSAGQGLIADSDVKINGFNIGRVKSVRLEDGRARVRMEIDEPERVPVAAIATIRPKTLFGEKFVDVQPGAAETSGPFLVDEGVIEQTIGGFELEKVLSDLYPVLQAVDPDELASVLSSLAEAGEGAAAATNRQIGNFATLSESQVRNDAELRQFLGDLVLLSDELANRSDDLVATATDLNQALPALNERGDELGEFLDQAARLSTDLADILQANRPFLEKSITQGGKTLQLLHDERQRIPPLVVGIRQFVEVLASVARIPFGDGTNLAAVKFVVGEDSPCGRTMVGCPFFAGTSSSASSASGGRAVSTTGAAPAAPRDQGTITVHPLPIPAPAPGAQGVLDTLVRLAQ